MFPSYEYTARIVRVIDGDTIACVVDLGFGISAGNDRVPMTFRLHGINAPEARGPTRRAGEAAAAWLRERLQPGTVVALRTHKDRREKYGRWLAEVFPRTDDICEAQVPLNVLLVEAGHAVYTDPS